MYIIIITPGYIIKYEIDWRQLLEVLIKNNVASLLNLLGRRYK
jgi:hypothetical protein